MKLGSLRALGHLARWGVPRQSLLFGRLSLGDDLLCTAVLREARRRGHPFAMMTSRPELFEGNSDPTRIIPVDDYYVAALRRLGARIVQPYYTPAAPGEPNRLIAPSGPIIGEMCRQAGITGEIAVRPYFHQRPEEVSAGRRFDRQIVLQSSVLSAALPILTKEWFPARMAEVARLLSPHFKLIQLGTPADPALPVDLDLRGRTTLREAAAILGTSILLVGLEGFLTHLARSVDCPAVVIMGGRWREQTVGYACNRNLMGAVPCSPCGLSSGCPNDMMCMSVVTVEKVVAAALDLAAAAPARPLPAETWVVGS